MAIGRPTEFNEAILTASKEYLQTCVDTVTQVVAGQSDKFTSYRDKVTVKLPSIEGLARHLKISKDTIYQWEKKHEAFSDVLHALRSEQAERLINMGLSGDYNPVISRMLLSKHGYADRTELTGADGEKLLPIIQIIRNDDAATQGAGEVDQDSNPNT